MTDNTEKLLPCPFCGSSEIRLTVTSIFSLATVSCSNCNAHTDIFIGENKKEKAIEAWNTRVSPIVYSEKNYGLTKRAEDLEKEKNDLKEQVKALQENVRLVDQENEELKKKEELLTDTINLFNKFLSENERE